MYSLLYTTCFTILNLKLPYVTIGYYISYDFDEVVLIKLSIVEYNCGY